MGESVARHELDHDPQTGFLNCSRVLRSGTSRGADDILVTYEHDGFGLVTDIKTYGGDLQALPTAGAGCGDLPAQPEYRVQHTYENGVRKSTRPYHSDGTPGAFLAYDVDLDASTGLVLASRDPAGLTTTYAYDILGREITMTPPGQADKVTSYVSATPIAPARLVEQRVSGSTVLTERETVFDDFGRPTLARVKLPGDVRPRHQADLRRRPPRHTRGQDRSRRRRRLRRPPVQSRYGWTLLINTGQGFRSWDQQMAYHLDPAVYPAGLPSNSFHVLGLAFDVLPFWDDSVQNLRPSDWNKIYDIAGPLGLAPINTEAGHFQMTFGKERRWFDESSLREIYQFGSSAGAIKKCPFAASRR